MEHHNSDIENRFQCHAFSEHARQVLILDPGFSLIIEGKLGGYIHFIHNILTSNIPAIIALSTQQFCSPAKKKCQPNYSVVRNDDQFLIYGIKSV